MSDRQVPVEIRLHRKTGSLELRYEDGVRHELDAEYLRVHSPSAEVRGHGRGQEVLQTGKRHVRISAVEPVGNYAVKLVFDDKHDSGIYSWEYLYELAVNHDSYWEKYLGRLAKARASREPLPLGTQVVNIVPLKPRDEPTG